MGTTNVAWGPLSSYPLPCTRFTTHRNFSTTNLLLSWNVIALLLVIFSNAPLLSPAPIDPLPMTLSSTGLLTPTNYSSCLIIELWTMSLPFFLASTGDSLCRFWWRLGAAWQDEWGKCSFFQDFSIISRYWCSAFAGSWMNWGRSSCVPRIFISTPYSDSHFPIKFSEFHSGLKCPARSVP